MPNRSIYVFYAIAIVAIFVTLFDLTLFLSIYVNPYVFGMILIYIVLLPALSAINDARIFFVVFPVPILGSWAISVYYLASYSLPALQGSIIASAIPVVLTLPFHLATRMRNMVFNRPMSSASRLSFGLASSIFFLFAPIVLASVHIELNYAYIVALFSMLQIAYVLSSLHLVNTTYRYRMLCRKLNVSSIQGKEKEIWRVIERKFSRQQNDVDLLRYYYKETINSFLEGAYEESFLSGYQMICERTVADPKNYISDKRDGTPESFSEIRTILMHSRRKETEIDVKTIRDTKRKLPQYCVELLHRDFALLKTVADDLPKPQE